MEIHMAYCGINCETCKLYQASKFKSNKLLYKLAEEWGNLYNRTFELEKLKCFGCKSDVVFELCNKCQIKLCNIERRIKTCTECSEYPCERIQQFIEWQKKEKTGVEMIF